MVTSFCFVFAFAYQYFIDTIKQEYRRQRKGNEPAEKGMNESVLRGGTTKVSHKQY
jgi:hypothetical protein